ncbi:GAF domain-like protein [Russula dissimulans]|nr:GAF domain-like protein [Russula dissimulans]
MPHDAGSFLPAAIRTKSQFWEQLSIQLAPLLEGQRNWVTNLANASSLIYHSLHSYPGFGDGPSSVHWCERLFLGPFYGKPACPWIDIIPGRGRGVCVDAFLARKSIVVPDVEVYPGHIASDPNTKSEIVCPLILNSPEGEVSLGVFDLDCLASGGFDDDDKAGLEKIAKLVVDSCDW